MGVRRWVIIALVVGCRDTPPQRSVADAGAPAVTSVAAVPTPTPTREPETPPAPIAMDAGPLACAILVAPGRLASPGPFALASRGGGTAEAWVRDGAAPRFVGAVDATKVTAPTATGGPRRTPGCVVAGSRAFCAGTDGDVHRYLLDKEAAQLESFTAKARAGTELAAAMVGSHAVVAYLRDHTTTEGNVTVAWIAADDGHELQLSEDGAGATSVALSRRGDDGALAVYIDARRAMCPVHARALTWAGDKLALGSDVVVLVAGGAETYTRVSLGAHGTVGYALLPIAHDLAFGVGAVKIDGEPRFNMPVVWSDYPNGLDPAPIAATFGPSALRVARIRPSAAAVGSPRVLEIGRVDADGSFVAYGILPTQGAPVDVAMMNDGQSVVVAYTDAAGGWIERLKCP